MLCSETASYEEKQEYSLTKSPIFPSETLHECSHGYSTADGYFISRPALLWLLTKIFLFTFLLLKQEWLLHGKQAFSKKNPSTSCSRASETHHQWHARCRKGLAVLSFVQCADPWSPVLHPLAGHHLRAPGQHQDGGGWQCQEEKILQEKAFSTKL